MRYNQKNPKNEACHSYMLFGTYTWAFLGTVVADYVRDHIKSDESPPIEA